jgi:mono/diheme cytochrome c family protein
MRVLATLSLLCVLALAVFLGVKIGSRRTSSVAGENPAPVATVEMPTPDPAATNQLEGFFLGQGNQRTYVQYASPDPVLRSFMQSVMDGSSDAKAKGREIFLKICAACHQPDGNGKDGLAPPLVGSEWVLAPTGARLARIVLNGFKGPVRVAGKDYNIPAGMPPLRANLNDDQIAVVLSFVRSHLGTNHAGQVPSQLVTAARKETNSPETTEFLLHISDQ